MRSISHNIRDARLRGLLNIPIAWRPIKITLLLLMVFISGCVSALRFSTVEVVGLEIAIEGNGTASWNAEPKDGQWLVSKLTSCDWEKSYVDPPLSTHRFQLEKSDEAEQVAGQILDNEIFIDGGPDLYVCHISAADAARFRALYDPVERKTYMCGGGHL